MKDAKSEFLARTIPAIDSGDDRYIDSRSVVSQLEVSDADRMIEWYPREDSNL